MFVMTGFVTQVLDWCKLTTDQQKIALLRPTLATTDAFKSKVQEIINNVKHKQDAALIEYTQKFDCPTIQNLKVTQSEFNEAYNKIEKNIIKSLEKAIENLIAFHNLQQPKEIELLRNGISLKKIYTPIDKVGLYIPAGTAPLLSTLCMLGVPSNIAKNPLRIVTTPPNNEGLINPYILHLCKILDIKEVFKCGGAQAIAALAYGTQSITKVDKIFGPGNSFVATAKSLVSSDPGGAQIDMPAGPSEVLIIADTHSNPKFIALDLLSQAEHDALSQVILLSTSQEIITQVIDNINEIAPNLTRFDIIKQSLANARMIFVNELSHAIQISNTYAPEHLILHLEGCNDINSPILKTITNAGSIFVGKFTPESLGDYASGTNHVLPTYGFARSLGGLGVESFMKPTTIQHSTFEGLQNIADAVCDIANIEGLQAHSLAVSKRIRS